MAHARTSIKVQVLCGGWSDEAAISRASGKACKEALEQAGYTQVDVVDIAGEHFAEQLVAAPPDVAFIALHGAYGEDGCIQGLLEVLHIPYTFSGVAASAVASNKNLAKLVYVSEGIPVADGMEVDVEDTLSDADLDMMVEKFGLPLFIKPASNGSSYGISKVHAKEEIRPALKKALVGNQTALVETCVEGTEITVPVIGNDEPQALPVVQINTGADFYDRNVKYEPSELHHVIPAQLDEETYRYAQELAVAAHLALGCRGVSRSDFIVTSDGTPTILETNTIPGMTEASLLPDSARHAGIEFSELCARFVELALEDGAR